MDKSPTCKKGFLNKRVKIEKLLLLFLDASCQLARAIGLSETMETRESNQSSRAKTKSSNQKEVFVQESGGGVGRLSKKNVHSRDCDSDSSVGGLSSEKITHSPSKQ